MEIKDITNPSYELQQGVLHADMMTLIKSYASRVQRVEELMLEIELPGLSGRPLSDIQADLDVANERLASCKSDLASTKAEYQRLALLIKKEQGQQ